MKRYRGEPLARGSRLAIISNDAIGNYVVGTPLMQAIQRRFPESELTYFGGKRTHEFALAEFGESRTFPLHGTSPRDAAAWIASQEPFDWVFNTEWTPFAMMAAAALAGEEGLVCGPCLDAQGRGQLPHAEDAQGDLWRDQEWIDPQITDRYPFLKSPFIGEMFCRLAYVEGDIPSYRLPSATPDRAIPDVLIAPSASLPEKLWPEGSWRVLCLWAKASGWSVGLLGAAPKVQGAHWKGSDLESTLVAESLVEDLRGAFSLPQVHGAIASAKAVFTLDNGILHIAAATSTPTVGLYRWGIHRLWAPPVPNLTVLTPEPTADVASIPADVGVAALEKSLS